MGFKFRSGSKSKPAWITLSSDVEAYSAHLIPTIGYGILALTLIDYITLLVPPQLANPTWEFQTIGRLIETVWAPLLGFLLVFIRRQGKIRAIEMRILSCLSWLALGLGVLYFLMLPLIAFDALRLDRSNTAQFNAQLNQQQAQRQQLEGQLNRLSNAELNQLLANQNQQTAPKISSPTALREQLLTQLNQQQQAVKSQAAASLKTQQRNLIKTAVKWGIGAAIAGGLMISIWKSSRWARIKSY